MNTELPKPFGLGEPSKTPAHSGMNVEAVKFDEIENGPYIVEFGKKGNKLIFHFFKNGPFSMGFRSRLFRNFVSSFNLYGRENGSLQIDWVPEFDSWCVILPDVLSMSPPPSDDSIRQAVKSIIG